MTTSASASADDAKGFAACRLSFALASVSLLASATPIHKYVHPPVLEVAVGAVLFAGIAWLPRVAEMRLANLRMVRSRWMLVALLAVFFFEALVVYPKADARKYVHAGSDQDDALVQAADQLRGGRYPYRFATYNGSPISAGPGWVMLHMPFHPLRVYALESPVLFALIAWLLRRRSVRAAFIFAAFLMLTPAIHLLVCNGSDLPVLSAAIFLLCFTAHSKGVWQRLLWVVLLGMVATARVNLIVLPAAMLFLRRDWRTARAWTETVAATLVAAGLHAVFYFIAPTLYTPFHLFERGGLYIHAALGFAIVCYLLCLFMLIRTTARTPGQMAAAIGCVLLLLHLPLTVGSLRVAHYNVARYSGYEFVSVCLVCLGAGVAMMLSDGREGAKAGREGVKA